MRGRLSSSMITIRDCRRCQRRHFGINGSSTSVRDIDQGRKQKFISLFVPTMNAKSKIFRHKDVNEFAAANAKRQKALSDANCLRLPEPFQNSRGCCARKLLKAQHRPEPFLPSH